MAKKRKVSVLKIYSKDAERKEALFRIIVAFASGIIFWVWGHLICVFILLNWFITLFTGKRNKDLAVFSEYFNTEAYKFMKYMTFVSNRRPFPFTIMERMSEFE